VASALAFCLLVPFLVGQDLDLLLQADAQGVKVQLLQQHFDGLRADAGTEAAALLSGLGHQLAVGGVGDQRVFFCLGHVRFARVDDDIGREVQYLFQIPGTDVHQHAHPAGDALKVPDVAHGRGQLDVAHPLPAHLGACDLHAALVADLFLVAVFDPLVFAAAALPVLHRPEDPLAE